MSVMAELHKVDVIDSHTEGEPTRVVVSGGPELGSGSMAERLSRFREQFDGFRAGVVCEPRGSEVVVGALLLEPVQPDSAAGVIFFNDVGYLGMCGHGTIGLVTTLGYLGRIGVGRHRIETPVGEVWATLHDDGSVSVENVESYRLFQSIDVEVPGLGTVTGDVAWGGNWFFLTPEAPCPLEIGNRACLLDAATSIRLALGAAGISGAGGALIDHVELYSDAHAEGNSGRNFVLCPGASFDRSPCGTGTSAKMACLHADGKLKPGETWRQEGILGTVFEGSIQRAAEGRVRPTIRGRARITAEAKLIFGGDDPFREGIRF
jgi:4-hydroxyproline epimerase